METITPNDVMKTNVGDAKKRARDKYYATHKLERREQQRDTYIKMKDTEDFKERKREYNRLYREKHKTEGPKKPSGRPRTVIINKTVGLLS